PGNDVLNGKVTLPLIYSLKQVGEASSREMIERLRQKRDHDTFKRVYQFISENGGLDYAYRRADELCRQGLESIRPIEASPYYDYLAELVRFTSARVA
ncbi:hypothetical protein C3F09_08495, partial [candidate division GN15 bacterium]